MSLGGSLCQPPQLKSQLNQEGVRQASNSAEGRRGEQALLRSARPFRDHLHACAHTSRPLSQVPGTAQVRRSCTLSPSSYSLALHKPPPPRAPGLSPPPPQGQENKEVAQAKEAGVSSPAQVAAAWLSCQGREKGCVTQPTQFYCPSVSVLAHFCPHWLLRNR